MSSDFEAKKPILVPGMENLLGSHQATHADMVVALQQLQEADNVLRQSEQRYDQLVRKIPVGIYTFQFDADGTMSFNYVSPRLCEILDLDAEAVLLDYSLAFTAAHPDDLDGLVKENEQARLTLQPFRWEGRFVIHSETRWIRISSDPTPLPGGASLWHGVVSDITESKQAEVSLRLLSEITENAAEGIALIRASDSRIHYINQRFESLLGYARGELKDQPIAIINAPTEKSPEETAAEINRILERDGVWRGEIQSLKKDGSRIWTYANISSFRHPELGTLWITHQSDLTERKLAEVLIQQSENRLRTIIDNGPECIKIVDAQGNLRQMNPAGLKMIEADSLEQVVGQRVLDVIAPEYREAYADMHRRVLAGEAMQMEFEALGLKGGRRWLETHAVPMQDGGETVHLAVTLDISVSKAAMTALQESESWFRSIFENAHTAIASTDSSGRVSSCNKAFCELLGYDAKALERMNFAEFTHPDDLQLEIVFFNEILAGQRDHYRLSKRYIASDGRIVWVDISVAAIRDAQGEATHFVAVINDISERRQAEAELRIAATAFNSHEGMMVTDANLSILRVNQAFTEITGYTAEEVLGQTPRMFASERHNAEFYQDMWQTIHRTGRWQGEIWDRRKNGEVYPKWLTISAVKDVDGTVTHYIGAHFDITERKQNEDKIIELAFFDQLTGLPNRTLLLDRLKQTMAANSRSGNYGALLFIDLDNFKTLNDTLGHDVGDMLLQQVADHLRLCVREGDTVARLGGDEFVVILAGLNTEEGAAANAIEAVADKILTTLNQTYRLGSVTHRSTASIGVTLFRGDLASIDDLMKQADLAMYKSKAAGRNLVRFFDPTLEVAVKERAALEDDLQRAIAEKQFFLHYQAQVAGGRLTGAEVLVRWMHPQRGVVSPAEFIPLAEETGLILPLGHWVLETACRQLAIWAHQPETAHLTVAVNVSAHQFHQRDFVDQVLAVLHSTGANPQRLKLELTESLLVSNVEEIIEKMFALKAKGVGFSLDDFGTGYSSLFYLKRLPLDQLKIDQSFVRDVLSDPNDAAIARTVIALAQSLGLGVIAEGVETATQRDFLASAGCHAYQGYFFSRPLPIDDFEGFARQAGQEFGGS